MENKNDRNTRGVAQRLPGRIENIRGDSKGRSTKICRAIIWTAAPAIPVLILALSGAAHAAMDQAKFKACLAAGSKCMTRCNQVFTDPTRVEACLDRCISAESKCFNAASNPGKLDTGGAPANPKDNSTKAGGGVRQ